MDFITFVLKYPLPVLWYTRNRKWIKLPFAYRNASQTDQGHILPKVPASVGMPSSWCWYYFHGILVSTAPNPPDSILPLLVYILRYPKIGGPLGSSACTTVWDANSTGCTWPPTFMQHLATAAADTLHQWPKKATRNQFIMNIADWYMNETRAILPLKTTRLPVASIFFDYWIVRYGTAAFLLTDRGPQFVRKFSRRYVRSSG